MSTIKISELATSNIALTDFFAKADANGVASKNTVQELSNLLKTVDDTAFKGSIAIADVPSENGWYFASESGTYTNCGGLVIDTTDNIAIIIISGTFDVFNKIDIPVNITIDAVPTDESNNAVQSGGIFNEFIKYKNLITEVVGKNLFSKDKISPETFLLSGEVTPIAGFFTSDFILVDSSTQYTHPSTQTAQYDINKNFISQAVVGIFTTSATTKFVRFSNTNASLDTMQFEIGGTATSYEQFLYRLTGFTDPMKSSEIIRALYNKSITYEKLVHTVGKNLFNKFTVIPDNFIDPATGVVTASVGFNASDWIEIEPSTAYFKMINNPLAFYDSNKVFVSGLSGGSAQSFTSPVGVAYIRISVSDAILEKEQLELGTVETDYEPFRFILSQLQANYYNLSKHVKQLISTQELSGLTWNSVGDSITEYDDYQPLVALSTGLTSNNYGVSSSTVAKTSVGTQNISMVQRVLGLDGLTAIPNADIWSLFGGVNDEIVSDTPIGAFATSSFDVTTFYGAYQSIIENIIGRTNNPKLLLITPTQTSYNGARIDSYRDCILFLAAYYSIPVLDLYGISGISPISLGRLTADGVHPNLTGTLNYYQRIIQSISNL
tara:strand:+ start:97 stop:1920 length:1824 start_codon:yes stop_codon:yes gene_type:complete